jgi:tetratricopeptide (TPR) repeat protein
LAVELCFDLRMALGWLAEYERALEYLHEGEAIAEALGDHRRQSGICARMIECLRALARYDEATEAGQRALQLAEEAGDGELRVNALGELGQHYYYRGQLRQAADALRTCVQGPVTTVDLRHLGVSRNIHVQTRHTLARVLGELGDFDEAIAYGMEALRLSEAGADRSIGIHAHNAVGQVFLERGDVTEALALVERVRDLARTVDSMNHRIGTLVLHGACLVQAGRTAIAISLLEEGMTLATASGFVSWMAYLSNRLGEAYLADGRIADARRAAMTALTHAEARQEHAARAVALRLLGEIAASGEGPDFVEAETRYRASLVQAEAMEMRPLQAHCHLGLGKLYRRVGRPEEARAELSTAIGLLGEMGMTFWLPEAEAELAKLNASEPVEPAG